MMIRGDDEETNGTKSLQIQKCELTKKFEQVNKIFRNKKIGPFIIFVSTFFG